MLFSGLGEEGKGQVSTAQTTRGFTFKVGLRKIIIQHTVNALNFPHCFEWPAWALHDLALSTFGNEDGSFPFFTLF